MNTKIIKIDQEKIDREALAAAGEVIKNGGLVAFPTETVYGLGGDALNPDSSEKIYRAKGRPSDNPLIIHIYRMEDLERIAVRIPDAAYRLAEAFWPGPLTMVLHKADEVPAATTGGLSTVAVRMPSHMTALAFIEQSGGFVAAPSANISGRPSPTLAKYVAEDMDGRIEMIIDGGSVGIGLESTIIDLTEELPVILRPGFITEEMLHRVIGELSSVGNKDKPEGKESPKAPGMKYRHYAPAGKLTIMEGNQESIILEINRRAECLRGEGQRVGVITTDSTAERYLADSVKSIGSRGNANAAAKHLYRILREFDNEGMTVIFSEVFDSGGMGQAVMNRLEKAAGHCIEHIE